MPASAVTGLPRAESEAGPAQRRSPVRRLLDFIFGYDFFVSYAWADGRVYAEALVRRLEEKRFDVFLDRDDFAMGEDWKQVGAWTLRRTSQLILVGSPLVRSSEPVAHELEIFATTQRRVIPIDFDGSLDGLDPANPLARHLPPELLRILEASDALSKGPSDETIATIEKTFGIVRQDRKRVRVLAAVATILAALAVAAVIFGVQASISEGRARDATQVARKAAAAEKLERERAVLSEKAAEASAEAARLARDEKEVQRLRAEDRQRFAEAQQRIAEAQRRIADEQRRAAEMRQLAAEAGQRYTKAATHFARAETAGSASDIEILRRAALRDEIGDLDLASAQANPDRVGLRLRNLEAEVLEADTRLQELAQEGRDERSSGAESLTAGDALWARVQKMGGAAAGPADFAPSTPGLFSVEVLSVGSGQSLILHYGMPDAPRFVIVDGGGGGVFDKALRPRLESLRQRWSPNAPLQLELVAISNQDDDRLNGIMQLLQAMIDRTERGLDPEFRINRIWYNSFGPTVSGAGFQKMRARAMIEKLALPLNAPFDHLAMRPASGRLTIELDGGLRATILGPVEPALRKLYEDWAKRVAPRRPDGSVDDAGQRLIFPPERFSRLPIAGPSGPPKLDKAALSAFLPPGRSDASLPNLASLIILFEYQGRRFLHTGDARGDQIMAGLDAAGLLDDSGRIRLDTLLIPHLGSDANVSRPFFERVRAVNYLFTGSGTFGNPRDTTIDMLLRSTPPGECINLYFLNREGDQAMGPRLDAYFAGLRPGEVCFRRIFRSRTREAMTVDLTGRVRY